ncbi:MAG: pyruvate kinase [Vicinamibacterales bacterium]
MRHTKIIATLGPASRSDDLVNELVAAGVDIFRLNFSHGTRESHAELYDRVRRAGERVGRIVAILQDLGGPKIRTGRLAGGSPVALQEGEQIRLAVGDQEGGPDCIFTTYADLPRAVKAGDVLLLDDGRIELRVLQSDGAEIEAVVVDGGTLGEHKGINAPGVALPAAALTAKDIDDLKFGLRLGVDMVAVSFVRNATDLRRAREIMIAADGGGVPLVAKLERPEAIAHLGEILESCDAVMVARGDLGLEIPLETVPRIQKDITRRARALGIPVIVATQVLESMRTEPRPTRAEVSDAANAVDDGVDAIMLAGETAIGAFPARAVRMLDLVIREAETIPTMLEVRGEVQAARDHEQALCAAAVALARLSDAHALIAVTRTGKTARVLSRQRPHALIYAATDRIEIARHLTLFRGVIPLTAALADDVTSTYLNLARHLSENGSLVPDATVVCVNVAADLTQPYANFVKLMRLRSK